MKILFLLDSLAPGGTEISTVALATELVDMGHCPMIVTLRSAPDGLEDRARAAYIDVRQLEATSLIGRVHELRRYLHRERIDVLHSALFLSDQIARLASVGRNVALVSSFVSTPYEETRFSDPSVSRWRVRVVQIVDAVTAPLVDRFHAVSIGAKTSNARALRVTPGRIAVAERGRDPAVLGKRSEARRHRTRRSLGLAPEDHVVLNLGRLDHPKAQTIFVAAVDALAGKNPLVVGFIAGNDGAAGDDVRRAIRESENADRIRLLGHRDDVGDLLCAADVLAISSYFEGTAGVAVEAMALETPIVATDIVGIAGVLENHRNAILVPAGDPYELASAIDELLTNRPLSEALARTGHSDFLNRFTLTGAAERLVALYEDVTAS